MKKEIFLSRSQYDLMLDYPKIQEVYTSKKLNKSWSIDGVRISGDSQLLGSLETLLRQEDIVESMKSTNLLAEMYNKKKPSMQGKKDAEYTKIEVTDKSGKLRGYMTPEEFLDAHGFPRSRREDLADLVKRMSQKSTEANFKIMIKGMHY